MLVQKYIHGKFLLLYLVNGPLQHIGVSAFSVMKF